VFRDVGGMDNSRIVVSVVSVSDLMGKRRFRMLD